MVMVNGVQLGAGRVAIIVPINAANDGDIEREARAIADSPADIVEWRADRYARLNETKHVIAIARRIAELVSPKPLIFTVRSRAEGGESPLTAEAYRDVYADVCASGAVQMADIEYWHPTARRTFEAAKAAGVLVIASNHDFIQTPPLQEIVDRLDGMEAMGADVCKIAVMPKSAVDVARLLGATAKRAERSHTPLITVSMGRLGKISRLAGHVFGSCATYAVVGDASAPGQLPIAQVQAVLELVTEP